jgi:SAM-dependent methyltransferase
MAADYALLTANLMRFYDFADKVVLVVGAGGGQLLDPNVRTKKLIAIDRDAAALKVLEEKTAAAGSKNPIEFVAAPFEEVSLSGDVVYFEFCLHEMPDPRKALAHARKLAPDIVIYDHAPDSEWIFYGGEEHLVRRSSEALMQCGVRRQSTFRTEQRFQDYAELLAKLAPQGPVAVQRAQRFCGASNIVIPMSCFLALT